MEMTYWERRQQELNSALEKDEEKLKKRLSSFYDTEYRKLEKEIAAYYSMYGEDKVIEFRNLMQNLSDEDKERLIKRMQDFAQLYPEYADLLPVRETIYKLNRLEGLQMSVLMQQYEIGSVDNEEIRKHLEKQALRNANAAAETMGYGKNFYAEDSNIIKTVVNTKWCNGKDFSERIWGNVEKLAQYLSSDIAAGFARGDSYEKLVRQLRQRFGKVSRNDAYRLIYTEGTHVMNEARAAAFEQDTEEYIFRIQYDKIRRSGWRDICDDLNEKVFRWDERKPGINFPPMHAWCHCTATPYVSDRQKFIEDYEKRHGNNGNGQAKRVANRFDSGIINSSKNTKEDIQVHSVGKINRDIYKCITEDIVTDEVIITDERIDHIVERRGQKFYDTYGESFSEIILNPDYIFADKANTALVCKEFKADDKFVNIVLRIVVSTDNPNYKNSIITAVGENSRRFQQRLRNNTPLYKKE